MNKRQILQIDRSHRVIRFNADHPIVPAIPRATVLFTQTNTIAQSMEAHGGTQVHGFGQFQGGVGERRILARDLRIALQDIALTARGLSPEQFPGVAEQFRLNNSRSSYQHLLNTAQAFLTAIAPIKTVFTDRGFTADFDLDLTVKVAGFATATGRKFGGLQELRSGTANLQFLDRSATATMKELNAIMTAHLRATDPPS